MSGPNHHGIALNSAQVIEDFSKSLVKARAEIERLKATLLIYAREEMDSFESDEEAFEYFDKIYMEHGGK